jgi:hypothetical protein
VSTLNSGNGPNLVKALERQSERAYAARYGVEPGEVTVEGGRVHIRSEKLIATFKLRDDAAEK